MRTIWRNSLKKKKSDSDFKRLGPLRIAQPGAAAASRAGDTAPEEPHGARARSQDGSKAQLGLQTPPGAAAKADGSRAQLPSSSAC